MGSNLDYRLKGCLPFIYMLGLRKEMEKPSFPVQGVDRASISMLAFKIG